MNLAFRSKRAKTRVTALSALAVLACQISTGQQTTASAHSCAPPKWTAQQDHQNMLDQLGIKALRPGPSGNEKAPNHANYDESKANPFPDLPDALTFKNGKRVTSATEWQQRRQEIVEDFEREVLGYVPSNVPKVTWGVAGTTNSKEGIFPVIKKQLAGHADNSACASINVNIEMTLVTPANAKGPVPVMMMFGSAAFLKRMADMTASRPELKAALGSDPRFDATTDRRGMGLCAHRPGQHSTG